MSEKLPGNNEGETPVAGVDRYPSVEEINPDKLHELQLDPRFTLERQEALRGEALIETGTEIGEQNEPVEITNYVGTLPDQPSDQYSFVTAQHVIEFEDKEGKKRIAPLEMFVNWESLPPERVERLKDGGWNPAELTALDASIFESPPAGEAPAPPPEDVPERSRSAAGDSSEEETREMPSEEPPADETDTHESETEEMPHEEPAEDDDPHEADTTVVPPTPEDDRPSETILSKVDRFNQEEYEREYYRQHGKPFKPAGPKSVYYEPDDVGNSQIAYEFRGGSVVDGKQIEKLVDKQKSTVVINASGDGGHYTAYIKDGKIYEIVRKTGNIEDGSPDESSVTVGELPSDSLADLNLLVGQKFGDFILNEVRVGAGFQQFDEAEIAKARAMNMALRGRKIDAPEYKRAQQLAKLFSNGRSANPFEEAELAIGQIEAGVTDARSLLDNDGRVIGSKAWTDAYNTESDRQAALHETDDYDPNEVRDRIVEFGELFMDRSFVPTIDQLKEMQDLARHIKVVDYNANRPVYRLSDGSRLPIRATTLLVQNARNSRWLMTDFAEKNYTKVSRETSPFESFKRKLFNNRPEASEKENSIFQINNFRDALESAGKIPRADTLTSGQNKAVERQVNQLYRQYIQQRVVLSRGIKENTKGAVMLQRDVFTDSFAINAYTAQHRAETVRRDVDRFSDSRKKTIRGKIAAKFNKGLDAIQRRSLKIDTAVRRRMEIVAFEAGILKDRAVYKINRGLYAIHRKNMVIDAAIRRRMEMAADQAAKARDKTVEKFNKGLNAVHRKNMKVDLAMRRGMDWTAAGALRARERVTSTLDSGLNSVHRKNMRVDLALRRGMDMAAIQALRAKEKAALSLDSGLDAVHQKNMKVDRKVRRGMDIAAIPAQRAKAKAENAKRLWDGDREALFSRPPRTLNQEALRDYVSWQRGEARRSSPRNIARRAVESARRRRTIG